MLSVIIPAYNEGNHIYDNLLRINSELNHFCKDYEIIFVDDGSNDSTASEAKQAAEVIDNIEIITYTKNGGKGHAIKEGFKKSSKDLITFLDADLDIPPQQIKPLLEKINETNADVVIQSKRHKDSVVNGFPIKRQYLSKSYNLIVKQMFHLPVSDTQVGIKLFKRKVLEMIMPKLLVKRYASDVEQLLLAYKYGFKIAECPVRINYNQAGDCMAMKDVFNIGWDTAAIYYRAHVLKYYDNAGTMPHIIDNKSRSIVLENFSK
jgi:glycosyltransferase involved in cell wall biosynthesis